MAEFPWAGTFRADSESNRARREDDAVKLLFKSLGRMDLYKHTTDEYRRRYQKRGSDFDTAYRFLEGFPFRLGLALDGKSCKEFHLGMVLDGALPEALERDLLEMRSSHRQWDVGVVLFHPTAREKYLALVQESAAFQPRMDLPACRWWSEALAGYLRLCNLARLAQALGPTLVLG